MDRCVVASSASASASPSTWRSKRSRPPEVAEAMGRASKNAYACYEQGEAILTIEKLEELLHDVSNDMTLIIGPRRGTKKAPARRRKRRASSSWSAPRAPLRARPGTRAPRRAPPRASQRARAPPRRRRRAPARARRAVSPLSPAPRSSSRNSHVAYRGERGVPRAMLRTLQPGRTTRSRSSAARTRSPELILAT